MGAVSDHLLAIDTSGPRLQLALATAYGVDVHVEDLPKGHAEVLFDRIGVLLGCNGVGYAGLTRLAVTTGPGSFTGLRIGISAARGLGLARKIPVVGVPNLLLISLGQDGACDVVLDARREESYVQSFSAPGVPLGPAVLVATAQTGDFPRAGVQLVSNPQPDIALLARFALSATPEDYPPNPAYIRAADAKPQAPRIAHAEPAR